MSKYNPNKPVASKEKNPYPSLCGSHETMLDKDANSQLDKAKEWLEKNELALDDHDAKQLKNKELVVCKDGFGLYITDKKRLDDRLADPNRYADIDWREKRLAQFKIENKKEEKQNA